MEKSIPSRIANAPFTTRDAVSCGLSKAYLTRMVRRGMLQRLCRGVYQSSGIDDGGNEEMYRVAALRCGIPSAICLLSALEFYHLTDQIPKQIWVLVPANKRIVSKDLKLIRSRKPRWDIGILKKEHYWITTLERTLIDGLLAKKWIGSQVALDAVRRAIKQNKAKLGDLYDMAKKMGVEHRVHAYLEALAA